MRMTKFAMEKVLIVIIVTMSLIVLTTCRFESYDSEEEAGTVVAIVNWMSAICGAEHERIPSTDFGTFETHLNDGVMLCILINKLLEDDGKRPVVIQKHVSLASQAVANIENFNSGCMYYGMAKEHTLQAGDLMDGRKDQFVNVLHCLHNLGFIANSKGYKPLYLGRRTITTDDFT
ncbi:uncharacterized protein LOC123548825 isoform X3 [Mercenaria mercenaria]|uniref:uncharacterized protein LOC123548825 isoform X3 n=1 Tax=Mercenaria mercenaria TaxID=6596 RepID=UPI00234E8ADA|nr:uncharacterized protein LOC123548825 isoform X3 [Mercenaria mercenaria]